MGRKKFPSQHTWIWSGANFGLPGGVARISGELIDSDAKQLRELVNVIDDKGVFFDPYHLEVPGYFITSIEEVRKAATATKSKVRSGEAAEIADRIATACRIFMRDFSTEDPQEVWSLVLSALRSEVGFAVSVAVHDFRIPEPTNLALSPLPHGGYSDSR